MTKLIEEFILQLHNEKNTSSNTEISYKRDLNKLYDYLKKENFNDDASYIAISVDSFNIIDASYAQGIISYLTSYNDKVINISYLELKNGNYFDENGSLEGIYINTEIIKTNKTKDKIELVVSKTKSSLAKVSIKCRATFKNGSWVIKEI